MTLCGLYAKRASKRMAAMKTSALDSAKLCGFVATRDRVRAKAFYQDVLGLKLISDDQFAVVFETGNTSIRVTPLPDHVAVQHTVLGWTVSNIEATVDALTKAGVKFETYSVLKQDSRGIWAAPGSDAKVAWFKDPDGNVLSVAQHS
jgi:catechol 2,3-dioxygenase-like lactoylglutathione lyase family enzyme